MITSLSFFRRMRNVSDKICRENQDASFIFTKFFPGNPDVYEIMRKYMVEPERRQVILECCLQKMRLGCRVTKARVQTHTHSI